LPLVIRLLDESKEALETSDLWALEKTSPQQTNHAPNLNLLRIAPPELREKKNAPTNQGGARSLFSYEATTSKNNRASSNLSSRWQSGNSKEQSQFQQ
jgi:hypothetical protein